MKKVLFAIMAVAFIGMLAAPAWAGGPEETGRAWIERSVESGRGPEAVPEVGWLYYIDLMSNTSDAYGNWVSILVAGNWSLSVRIHVFTSFIPTGGTPNDIVNANFYINANDIAYLTSSDLGFNTYGQTNWFGLLWSDSNIFFTAGVLLFHSEYGLTWIPGVGPYAI
ncbi:MAG: hypothetical protein JRD68_16370 [Deltaproteobacteria bacterium]|nr:hypothetical protein [Deltaproteobacteria bacterium]